MATQSISTGFPSGAQRHVTQYAEIAKMKGSAGPLLRTLCDARVIPCSMIPATEGSEARMGIHCLVYLARSRFACPNLGQFDFHEFADVPYSPTLDWSFELHKSAHDYEAMDWNRRTEFVEFARNHTDYRWLSAASLICVVTDRRRDESMPIGRDDVLNDPIMDGFHISGDHIVQVYDSLPKALLGPKTG